MGKWIEMNDGWFQYHYCPECGVRHFNPGSPLPAMCPECHAHMEGDDMYMKDISNMFVEAYMDSWEDFRDNFCRHQSATVQFHGEKRPPTKACDYYQRKLAKCWADWRECKPEICPFLHRGEQDEQD